MGKILINVIIFTLFNIRYLPLISSPKLSQIRHTLYLLDEYRPLLIKIIQPLISDCIIFIFSLKVML